MSTGLASFDAFAWSSLLAGRSALVCDGDRQRGLRLAEALEEAGAKVTLAPSQAVATEHLLARPYRIILAVLPGGESLSAPLRSALASAGKARIVLMMPPGLDKPPLPAARRVTLDIADRDLVLLLAGSADE
ncbi:hypothetical protein [Mangrovicella endophytica]|uniref:hypothetical protein n=1 Tax=Mangrovicella endophytica TaxID=2066697 RepID=UPI0013000B25|nr:hypothetical protein [Mangrovicella endophytica]